MSFKMPAFSEEFDLKTASALCDFAFATYEDSLFKTKDELLLGEDCVVKEFPGPETDTRAIIFSQNRTAVVAFRGTQAGKAALALTHPEDWVAMKDIFVDVQFLTEEFVGFPNAKVHHGFLNSLESVWDKMLPYLRNLNLTSIAFTGHSLGGGIAIPASLRASREGLPVQCVYTFGSPRVGNKDFADAFNSRLGNKTYRVVSPGDFVARLPARDRPTIEAIFECIEDRKISINRGVLLLAKWVAIHEEEALNYSHAGRVVVIETPFANDWKALETKVPSNKDYIEKFARTGAADHLSYPDLLKTAIQSSQQITLKFSDLTSPY